VVVLAAIADTKVALAAVQILLTLAALRSGRIETADNDSVFGVRDADELHRIVVAHKHIVSNRIFGIAVLGRKTRLEWLNCMAHQKTLTRWLSDIRVKF
jgi:hypothetical protein